MMSAGVYALFFSLIVSRFVHGKLAVSTHRSVWRTSALSCNNAHRVSIKKKYCSAPANRSADEASRATQLRHIVLRLPPYAPPLRSLRRRLCGVLARGQTARRKDAVCTHDENLAADAHFTHACRQLFQCRTNSPYSVRRLSLVRCPRQRL